MEEVSAVEIKPKRPVFLLILCILSYCWLLLGISGTIMNYASGPSSEKAIQKEKASLDAEMAELEKQGASDWGPTIEKFKTMVVTLNRKFYYVQAMNLLVFLLGAFAVTYMLIGRKLGFHLYIIYSLLSVCTYYFFMPPSSVPTIIIMFSSCVAALFILMYSRNLKWMK